MGNEDPYEPRAQAVAFDPASRKIIISLVDGTEFKFSPELVQGLSNATDAQIADVRVGGNGFGLHWDSLDVDMTVPGLMRGVFGTRRFMAQQVAMANDVYDPIKPCDTCGSTGCFDFYGDFICIDCYTELPDHDDCGTNCPECNG